MQVSQLYQMSTVHSAYIIVQLYTHHTKPTSTLHHHPGPTMPPVAGHAKRKNIKSKNKQKKMEGGAYILLVPFNLQHR